MKNTPPFMNLSIINRLICALVVANQTTCVYWYYISLPGDWKKRIKMVRAAHNLKTTVRERLNWWLLESLKLIARGHWKLGKQIRICGPPRVQDKRSWDIRIIFVNHANWWKEGTPFDDENRMKDWDRLIDRSKSFLVWVRTRLVLRGYDFQQ